MNIDNTAFTLYMKCPKLYYERYEAPNDVLVSPPQEEGDPSAPVTIFPDGLAESVLQRSDRRARFGIVRAGATPDLDFGSRFHELAESDGRRKLGLQPHVYGSLFDPQLERECQSTFAGWCAHWLGDPLELLAAEETHTIPMPGCHHSLVVKIDRVVRFPDGTIGPDDIKTERAPGNNFRENWAGRTQASLYLWACSQLYPGEQVSRLVVDVVTRGSARKHPIFSRLDDITRTPAELSEALSNVAWVCDDIELSRVNNFWRSNMNVCKDSWKRCDYYDLHVYGRTEGNLKLYRPAEEYLNL